MQEAGIRITAKNETRQAFQDFEKAATRAAKNSQQRFDMLSKSLKTASVAFGAVGIAGIALIRNTTLLAARVQTLGTVMHSVGRTTGRTADELDAAEAHIRGLGITTQVARQSLIQMMQAQLDLTKSTELARIAQNAAVIANLNSSQAFEQMIYAINTLNPRVLKTMGLTISLEQAYSDYAKEQGITINQIDMQTKKQIAMNAVIEAGTFIADAYTSAMETAGKKLTSLPRHLEEAKLAIGQAFLPAFASMIDLVTGFLEKFNELPPSIKRFAAFTIAAGTAMSLFLAPMLLIVAKFGLMSGGLSTAGSAFFSLGINIKALATGAGFLTTKLAMLAPALGALAVAATVVVAFVALAAMLGKVLQFTDDLRVKNEELVVVVQKHNREIASSTMTQEDYLRELERSVDLSNRTIWTKNKEIITLGEWNRKIDEGGDAHDLAQNYVIAYTEAEREKLRVQLEAAEAAGVLDQAMGDIAGTSVEVQAAIEAQAAAIEDIYSTAIENINMLIGIQLSESMGKHEETMDSLKDKYQEVSDKLEKLNRNYKGTVDIEGTWANQQKEGLLVQLGEAQSAIDGEAAAWERNTAQVLFNMAARALESLPIEDQAAALAALASEMDLVDPATAAAFAAIGELTGHLENGTIQTDEYVEAVVELNDWLLKLPSEVFVNVKVKISQEGKVSFGGGGRRGSTTLLGTSQGGASNVATDSYTGFGGVAGYSYAQGGWLNLSEGWARVGEEGEEFISPQGYVYNAQQTKMLKRMGVNPKRGFQGGGEYYDYVYGYPATTGGDVGDTGDDAGIGNVGGGGGGGGLGGLSVSQLANITGVFSSTATVVANKVAQETAGIVAASAATLGSELLVVTQQQTEQFRQMIRSQEEAANRQSITLEQIRDAVLEQGTSLDMANYVSENLEKVDFA